MNTVVKGQYRYLPLQFRKELIKTIAMFAISIAILVIGMITTMQRNPGITWADSKNNILTVAAVLGLLPACHSLISTIMFVKGKKYTCPEKLHQSICELQKEQAVPVFCYDLYFTSYDKTYPVYVMAATENELLGLLADKADVNKAQEHIKEALQKDGQKYVTVKLYQEQEKFLERIEAAVASNASATEQGVQKAKATAHMEVMLQISL